MRRVLILAALALLAFATTSTAVVPHTISYQGILKNDLGEIVPDDDYDFTFKLYDVDSGGTALWTENQTLTVTNGVFDAILGDVTPINLTFDIQYWLGVAVDGDPELAPRVQLSAGGYALNADRLDGLHGSSFSLTNHTHILDDLADTDCPAPADEDVLTYDSGTGDWVAAPVPAAEDGDWNISGDDIWHIPGHVGIGILPTARLAPAVKPDGFTQDRDAWDDPKLRIDAGTPDDESAIYAFFSDGDDLSDARAAIYGYRNSGYQNPGADYSVSGTNAAVTGANWYGDPYSFGVSGYTYFDGPNTGGVIGSRWQGDMWGALGYNDATGQQYGVYTPYRIYSGGNAVIGGSANVGGFKLATGGAAGKVLTSDANGVGTWQVPAALPDNDWTVVGADMYSNVSGSVGIGTTTPSGELNVYNNNNGPTSIRISNPNTGSGSIERIDFEDEEGTIASIALYDNLNASYPGQMRIFNNRVSGSIRLSNGDGSINLLSNGEVGIGTASTSAKLDVEDATDDAIEGRCTHTTATDRRGVYGISVPTDWYGIGGQFEGGWTGVRGEVYPTGSSSDYNGVFGYVSGGSGNNYGVRGYVSSAAGTDYAIYGYKSGGGNYAGYFSGNVHVSGTLTKSAGSFKIDHPLDPQNKTLSHSFVESPDMMNIYNGNVVLDAAGEAVVAMPEWFEALNMEFRYQLTCIGGFAQVYIAEEIEDNTFKIAGGTPGLKVSWQVTGIRHDTYAQAHPIVVEEMKPDDERGYYLNAEAFGLPEEMSSDYQLQQRPVEERESLADNER